MKPPGLDIDAVRHKGRLVAVDSSIMRGGSFWQVTEYAAQGSFQAPPVLVVAPLSGHWGWLMRDTVLGLLPGHRVFLLEWLDAGDVPLSAGSMGLGAVIAAIARILADLGRDCVALGVSQSAATLLAAAALNAGRDPGCQPLALILMGGFVDPRINPTAVTRMTAQLPQGWFTTMVGEVAGPERPGAGRRLYPARLHGQALGRYLSRHLGQEGELRRKCLDDDGTDPERFSFVHLYTHLMDLSADYAEENAQWIFAQNRLPLGQMVVDGVGIEPGVLDRVGLMTVEGGQDDSSGSGQTHAAQDLCPRIPAPARLRLDVPQAGHFGLFHGQPWRSIILPRVMRFLKGLRGETKNSLRF